MMLSNADIKAAIAAGELVIEPFREDLVGVASVNLRLGPELLKPLPGKVVDPLNEVIPDFETIELKADKPYALKPAEFVLAHTYETITIGPSLGLFIEGRSTLARVGLTVVQTAMMVDPGHSGRTITLELASHGPNPILLYPKMKIAAVALFRLKTPCTELYDQKGKYRNQQYGVGKPIFKNELVDD